MPRKRWIVCVDWIDGPVEDTDEVVVYAESASRARSLARQRWRLTKGAEWPNCRIQKIFVLTKKVIERLGC